MRTLVLAPFDPLQIERLRIAMPVEYESWLDTRKLTDPEELGARLRASRASILVVEADFVFEETFDETPNLRFVGICRASTNHIDIEAATKRGVTVVNAPARNARAVAEHALALMFSLARRIPLANAYVTSGEWKDPVEPYISMRGIELGGRAVGIIGLGAIGSELARLCAAIGMSVIGYDPFAENPPSRVRMASLDDLAANSDFISVHVPATADTAKMLDAKFISSMNRYAFLINCSDPAIVDREALVHALESRRIAGAACDVFETHPIAPNNPMLKLRNAILTPHIGGATTETIQRHSKMMTDDILRFARGERPVNLVNPEAWSPNG